MNADLVATRVHQRDAKTHFEAGGTVLVSDRGHEPTQPVGRNTNVHTRRTTTWEELADQVHMWRSRHPNQRFYIVWPKQS